AIATLALSVVLYTFVVNWDYVGGARGAYILQPREVPFGLRRYIHLLYSAMVLMTALALVVARAIETSFIGRGLAAIRDDELAAGLLGTVQQVVQVTISSAWNLLIVGVLLVLFVTLAPNGIMGWVDAWRRRKRR